MSNKNSGEPQVGSPLAGSVSRRQLRHKLADVLSTVIKASRDDRKEFHQFADKCSDEEEKQNASADFQGDENEK